MNYPQCVCPAGDIVGEAAVWSADESAVYWTDVCRFLIHRFDINSGSTHTWLFDEPVVALSLSDQPGLWLVALASRLIWWWPKTDARRDHGFVLQGYPQVRLNDGRADPVGNFWVGSMRNNVLANGEAGQAGGQDGVVVCVHPDGATRTLVRDLGIANTLCWSPDQRTFYTADTLANCVWAFDYDAASASISKRRPFFAAYERGLPDGSAIDAEGYVWNCRFFGQCIVRISPQGRIDRVIDMPVRNLTTATFGGADLRTLYVTSASLERAYGDRLAGSLWALRCDVPGLPENRVKTRAIFPDSV